MTWHANSQNEVERIAPWRRLGSPLTNLWEIMQYAAHQLFDIGRGFGSVTVLVAGSSRKSEPDQTATYIAAFDRIAQRCEEIELTVSAGLLRRYANEIRAKADITDGELAAKAHAISDTISTEL